MLNHTCILEIKPTWSCWMIFLMCSWVTFTSILLFLHQCSWRRLDCNSISLLFHGLGVRVTVTHKRSVVIVFVILLFGTIWRLLLLALLWNSGGILHTVHLFLSYHSLPHTTLLPATPALLFHLHSNSVRPHMGVKEAWKINLRQDVLFPFASSLNKVPHHR